MGNCVSNKRVEDHGVPSLYQFSLNRIIGKGAFGKVRIVEHKRTHKLYALKYISKAQCTKQKAVANTIQERRLLEEIDHPFVCNMRYAFQDDENCFFVLDLMLGGDLRFHLDRRGPMPEAAIRLWTAELASAVEYLHRQRIIHRDIKPDNVLLDSEGHAHLTDFNVAIHYSERRLHTSIGGSMAYMAPEMLATRESRSGREPAPRGYTWCIDWWSLGVTMFELAYFRRPFDAKSSDKMKELILTEPIRFEPREGKQVNLSAACVSMLQGFLQRDPRQRLGCAANGQGIEDIRNHPFFQGIDEQKLHNKEYKSALIPDSKRPNFDVTHELDEFLMLEKPLTKQKRKENVDPEKMTPEMRELETKFLIYDFESGTRMAYFPTEEARSSPGHSPQPSLRQVSQSVTRTQSSTRTRTSPSPTRSVSRATMGSYGGVTTAVHSQASLAPTDTYRGRSAAGTPVPVPVDPRLQRMPPPLPPSVQAAYGHGYGAARPPRKA